MDREAHPLVEEVNVPYRYQRISETNDVDRDVLFDI
jgi:hypothetical protein